jgi:hypothetical protein
MLMIAIIIVIVVMAVACQVGVALAHVNCPLYASARSNCSSPSYTGPPVAGIGDPGRYLRNAQFLDT